MNLRRLMLIGLVFGHALGLALSPGRVRAQSDGMLISQLQTGGIGSGHASEEFIELYNSGAVPLSLDGWHIQYRTATIAGDCTKGWSTKVTLPASIVVPAYSYWLAAATNYLSGSDVDGRFAPGIPGAKGALRLLSGSGQTVDALAWGGAACGNGTAALAIPDGQSLERRPGSDQALGGNGINTTDNLADFILRGLPLPRSHASAPEPPLSGSTTVFPVLQLTEVGFGSAAFIELHNPTGSSVQVSAYALVVAGRVYHLLPMMIEPDGYKVIWMTDAKLTLSDSGGEVRLTDPAGGANDQAMWSRAPAGAAWASLDGSWQWTALPTPGAANIAQTVTDPPVVELPALPVGLVITELLINPAAPLRDAADEYVELFNGGEVDINLTGYVLRSGLSLGNKTTLGGLVIPAGSYLVLSASTTHLPLANDGGRVALFDSIGRMIGPDVSYAKAPSGQAYALFDNGWKWTALPTPGASNLLAAPAPAVTIVKTAAKSGSAKKVIAPKATSLKAAKVKASKPVKVKAAAFTAKVPPPSGRWLLFVLVGLTMVYISYEFRLNLQHVYYRARRYLAARRTPRPEASGSDGSGADQ